MSVGTPAHTRRALARSSSGGMSSHGRKPWLWPIERHRVRSWSIERAARAAIAGSRPATASGTARSARTSSGNASLSAGDGSSPSNSRYQTSSSERFSASSTAEYCR